jgi:hypothetical protein
MVIPLVIAAIASLFEIMRVVPLNDINSGSQLVASERVTRSPWRLAHTR